MRNPIDMTRNSDEAEITLDKSKYYFQWQNNATCNFMWLPETEQAKIDQFVLEELDKEVSTFVHTPNNTEGTMHVSSKYSWDLVLFQNYRDSLKK